MTHPGCSPASLRPSSRPFWQEMTIAARPASLERQLSMMAEADERDLLPRIAVPTLLIWGDADTRSPLDVARQFENAIPDAELVVIPGAGHVSNLENPAPSTTHSAGSVAIIRPAHGTTSGGSRPTTHDSSETSSSAEATMTG